MPDLNNRDWIYDIETYMDIFCACLVHVRTRTRFIFEVSDRADQSGLFIDHLMWLRDIDARMFGYNNEHFDWPVCDHLISIGQFFTAADASRKATAIIQGRQWDHVVWPDRRIVKQGDLFKIHHFDNPARSTSLKKLEINMRSRNVMDLPYPPDQPTTSTQKDEIIRYMCHDVGETLKFYHTSLDQIKFRDELAERYPDLGDVLNMNDTKIGKKYFEYELTRRGTDCYYYPMGQARRSPRQTLRDTVRLGDVISPRVTFTEPEFQRVKDWLASQVLTKGKDGFIEAKGVFDNVSATVDGLSYDFGTGGIHGSLHSTVVHEDDEYEIWDWDVASYYPNIAITNGFFPAHLSASFCDIYKDVYEMRLTAGKKTTEGAMLKLALNGVYGDSNNKYSVFYDPQYTMAITINGQLFLCMLAERLIGDGISVIQINTDGLTVKVRKDRTPAMRSICSQWEIDTGLELESARYSSMYIRDVNSYIAVKHGGGVKRIGAYAYQTWFDDPGTRERQWHQDHSALVVRKAAEAAMLHGTDVEKFIMNHRDPFDFQLSVKVPRSSRLTWGEKPIQNTTRYYVSTSGEHLTKIMPPLKGSDQERHFAVEKGWRVTPTNDMAAFEWVNVNWLYYITEAKKLVIT